MLEPVPGNPSRLIYQMAVLQMTVAELKDELLLNFAKSPGVSFVPYDAGIFVSDRIDVAIRRANSGFAIETAEPEAGRLILTPDQDPTRNSEWRLCQQLIEAISHRRAVVHNVSTAIVACLPEFPRIGPGVHLFELARMCDIHVTTVARALDNKVCETTLGVVPMRHFLTQALPGDGEEFL